MENGAGGTALRRNESSVFFHDLPADGEPYPRALEFPRRMRLKK